MSERIEYTGEVVNPFVTVIIPVYNREKLIEKCIKSVQRQDLVDIEILCIDDGSTDMSSNVIRSLMREDHRIKLICQNNHGAGFARNVGMQNAKGKYVSFLDSDDFYEDEDALSMMFFACENNHVPICGARVHWEYEGEVSEYTTAECMTNAAKNNGYWIDFYDYQSDRGYCGFIYLKEWLLENGIMFPGYVEHEDPVFFLQAMIKAKGFWFVPVYLLSVRMWDHGNEARREKAVVDILSGIKNNLELAGNNGYLILARNIIERLSSEYKLAIINGICDEVLVQLIEINKMRLQLGIDCEIEVLKDIYKAIQEMNLHRKSNEAAFPAIIKDKLDKAGGLRALMTYFENNRYFDIIMYGAGNYGNAFYVLAKKCKVNVVAVVDRDILTWDGKPVLRPEDSFPMSDAVFITLNEYQKVMEDMRRKMPSTTIVSFIELLNRMEKKGDL